MKTMLERVEIRAESLRVGDRLTEWCGPWHIGVAEGPSERVTELYPAGCGDESEARAVGFVEAWTDTGVIAGMPAVACSPWQPITVWREVSR